MTTPETPTRSSGPYFQLYAEGRSAPVRWRLLSGNHRDLGRGVVDHPDVAASRGGIEELIEDITAAEFGLVRADGHRWSWRLTIRGAVVAGSGHSFDRRTRCEQGYELFVQLAPLAAIRDELAVWPARGRPPKSTGRPPSVGRVSASWSAVHPRSADRPLAPGYLGARKGFPGSTAESTEASK